MKRTAIIRRYALDCTVTIRKAPPGVSTFLYPWKGGREEERNIRRRKRRRRWRKTITKVTLIRIHRMAPKSELYTKHNVFRQAFYEVKRDKTIISHLLTLTSIVDLKVSYRESTKNV